MTFQKFEPNWTKIINSPRYKVVTIVGTRPEIIRVSQLVPRFDSVFDHRFVHTGQNDDPNLNEIFFSELSIREPDIHLGIDNRTLGTQLGTLFVAVEKILDDFRPDAFVVLGDTNSSLASIVARRMGIAVYHLEAGNRSFDNDVPEEINRRVVDHVAHFNLPYSERARENLLREGIHPRTICLTGSPLREVLDSHVEGISRSHILSKLALEPSNYVLASIHRQENLEDAKNLSKIIATLELVSETYGKPVVLSTHPRTRKKLEASRMPISEEKIILHEPFSFYDYITLQKKSFCVLSDSGSISEEASILGFPAVTIRKSMERPEALETGSIILTGFSPRGVLSGVNAAVNRANPRPPLDYQIENFSERVTLFILSTVGVFRNWFALADQSDEEGAKHK